MDPGPLPHNSAGMFTTKLNQRSVFLLLNRLSHDALSHQKVIVYASKHCNHPTWPTFLLPVLRVNHRSRFRNISASRLMVVACSFVRLCPEV